MSVREASGVRTAGMQPKDFLRTREIQQAQAKACRTDKLARQGRSDGLVEVRLAIVLRGRESRLHGEAASRR